MNTPLNSNSTKVLHLHEKPWCICRLGELDAKSRVVRRYTNRQDADDDLRQITHYIKDNDVQTPVFDVVESFKQTSAQIAH